MRRCYWLLLLPLLLFADVSVDLKDPVLEDGVLSTEDGGVVRADGIRIQAREITYGNDRVEATGDLMLEYCDNVFIGEKICYDLATKEGWITCGRGAIGRWYLGGEQIHLLPNGGFETRNGYITTSEDRCADWKLKAKEVCVTPNGYLTAKKLSLRFWDIPVIGLPSFRSDLRRTTESPLQLRSSINGPMGSFVGLRYRFLDRGAFKAFGRLDYYITHGPGAGLDTEYCPTGRYTRAFTESYIARDRSIEDPINRTRYRVAGRYDDCIYGFNTRLRYAWLSDREMATDYNTNNFNLRTPRWTELEVYRKSNDWLGTYRTRVRINTFQAINQELPKFAIKRRPFNACGLLSFNRASAAYLDYVFAYESRASGFNGGRVALQHTTLRPVQLGALTVTPGVHGTAIFYSNTPNRDADWLLTAEASVEANTRLSNTFGCAKHLVEPYARYGYTFQPTSRIPNHFIFSIDDGYTLLNITRVGIRNWIYTKCGGCLKNPLSLDLFAYAFLDTPSIKGTIPRLYADLNMYPTSSIQTSAQAAWNVSHHRIDHFNAQLKWTASENVAVNILYRYRSPFVWKKAEWDNFVLDSFVPEQTLVNSPLSDRRYTLITRIFWRISPTWAVELESRQGWHRTTEPAYTEGKLSFHFLLKSRWHLTAYVERFEWRKHFYNFGLNLTLGSTRCPSVLGQQRNTW